MMNPTSSVQRPFQFLSNNPSPLSFSREYHQNPPSLGSKPVLFTCPNCYQTRMTSVRRKLGPKMYIASGICCVSGCTLESLAFCSPFFFDPLMIPFSLGGALLCLMGCLGCVIPRFKDTIHSCSGCGTYAGIYKCL